MFEIKDLRLNRKLSFQENFAFLSLHLPRNKG